MMGERRLRHSVRRGWWWGGLVVAVGLAVVSVVAAALPTTVTQIIRDRDGNNLLETGRGEPYEVRTTLGTAATGRQDRRVSRIFFAQLTDAHIVDEESPLRVEFADVIGPPLTSAYRPQEGLSSQVLNEMVRQVRESVSPVSHRTIDLVMTTGDNSDNTQRNEVRWFIDLLDGGVRVDPNSGAPGTCGTIPDGHLYDGVRGAPYYEPDTSTAPGTNSVDGIGYAPTEAENLAEASRSVASRDFPGLFEQMNKPFQSVGLGVPWYGIFGNHDGLMLGVQPRSEGLEAIATGCIKIKSLSPAVRTAVQPLLANGLTAAERGQLVRLITDDMLATAADPARARTFGSVVPEDPERVPLKKTQYMWEHFNTVGTPVGHGFTWENLRTGQGNFTIRPTAGVRFIVLDSINEHGFSDGNIDDTQFRWLHQQLLGAEARKEVVMVFAHHSLRTMNTPAAVPFVPGDQGGDSSLLVHFGLGPNGTTATCPTTSAAAAPTTTETLRCLFMRHRSVIAFVTGHEHVNRVTPFARTTSAGANDGGFWEITTASHIDWPQQSRLLDLFDNRDGTLSIFATMVDHAAVARTSVPTNPNIPLSADAVSRLASIGRELSFNDPQGNNGEDGQPDRRGTTADRNVELLIKHPY